MYLERVNDLENEKFQELVLNHLAKLTQEITELKGGQQRLESKTDSLETKVDLIQTQTAELTENMSTLSARMDQGFSNVVEVQKSLLEMYGEHEAAIRTLRRVPV
jgi:archaellum component FlaC